jgi:hypothetical protein
MRWSEIIFLVVFGFNLFLWKTPLVSLIAVEVAMAVILYLSGKGFIKEFGIRLFRFLKTFFLEFLLLIGLILFGIIEGWIFSFWIIISTSYLFLILSLYQETCRSFLVSLFEMMRMEPWYLMLTFLFEILLLLWGGSLLQIVLSFLFLVGVFYEIGSKPFVYLSFSSITMMAIFLLSGYQELAELAVECAYFFLCFSLLLGAERHWLRSV